jgi:uncharacterized membrane protein YhaH (DUF805 family)
MKCPNCKNTIPISSKFCEFCGHEIKAGQEIKKVDNAANSLPRGNEGFFDKRAGRKHFWIACVASAILAALLNPAESGGPTYSSEISSLVWLLYILSLLYAILVTIWRLNDLGKPKWYIFGLLIPLVNIFIGFDLSWSRGKLHKSLTGGDKVIGLLKCPKCGRTYSQSKTTCSYDKTPLKPE